MIARVLPGVLLALLIGCTGLPGAKPGAANDPAGMDPSEAVAGADQGYVLDDPAEAPADGSAPAAETTTDPVPEFEPEPEPAPEPEVETAPPPEDRNAAARAACLKGGGRFQKTQSGGFICVSSTRDAYKACNKPSQCQGECLARSRTCAPFTPLVGCHDIITASGGMATVCID